MKMSLNANVMTECDFFTGLAGLGSLLKMFLGQY